MAPGKTYLMTRTFELAQILGCGAAAVVAVLLVILMPTRMLPEGDRLKCGVHVVDSA